MQLGLGESSAVLLQAARRAKLPAMEYRTLLAILEVTYWVGKDRAEISLYDLQQLLDKKKYLVEEAVKGLISKGFVSYEDEKLGPKGRPTDWLPKNGSHINIELNNNSSNHVVRLPKNGKQTPPELFLCWVEEQLGRSVASKQRKLELSAAVHMYRLALETYKDPIDACNALKDCLLHYADDNFRLNIRLPLVYLKKYFSEFIRQTPRKPQAIRNLELLEGRRFRYNIRIREFEITNERLIGKVVA